MNQDETWEALRKGACVKNSQGYLFKLIDGELATWYNKAWQTEGLSGPSHYNKLYILCPCEIVADPENHYTPRYITKHKGLIKRLCIGNPELAEALREMEEQLDKAINLAERAICKHCTIEHAVYRKWLKLTQLEQDAKNMARVLLFLTQGKITTELKDAELTWDLTGLLPTVKKYTQKGQNDE